jgi:hypothetical protein
MTPLPYPKREHRPKTPSFELVSAYFLIGDPLSQTLERTSYDSKHGFYCECVPWKFRKIDWDCPHIKFAKSIVNGS